MKAIRPSAIVCQHAVEQVKIGIGLRMFTIFHTCLSCRVLYQLLLHYIVNVAISLAKIGNVMTSYCYY